MSIQFFSTLDKKFQYRTQEICSIGGWSGIFAPLSGVAVAMSDDELCDFANLTQPKLSRTLSRSALLLITLCDDMRTALDNAGVDRSRVGIYGAIGKGVTALSLAEKMAKSGLKQIPAHLVREIPPTLIFKEALYVPASQLSISLEITGPVSTFPHWRYGIAHCMSAADSDFKNNVIDAALVFGSSALDNPFSNVAVQSHLPTGTLQKEVASAALFGPDELEEISRQLSSNDSSAGGPTDPFKNYLGYAAPLIRLQESLRGRAE